MSDLALYQGFLSRLVPDWIAGAKVDCVPGSGVSYTGRAALVITPERLLIVSEKAEILITVYYVSVLRVREIEFKGLVIERDGTLVAPNETAGVEIAYNGEGKFERTIKVLTKSGNNARSLIDSLNSAVQNYLDEQARGNGLFLREE